MTTPEKMIQWLEKEGRMNDREIADRLNSTQATIWRIGHGKQNPKYDLGVAIQKLYEQIKAERSAA